MKLWNYEDQNIFVCTVVRGKLVETRKFLVMQLTFSFLLPLLLYHTDFQRES